MILCLRSWPTSRLGLFWRRDELSLSYRYGYRFRGPNLPETSRNIWFCDFAGDDTQKNSTSHEQFLYRFAVFEYCCGRFCLKFYLIPLNCFFSKQKSKMCKMLQQPHEQGSMSISPTTKISQVLPVGHPNVYAHTAAPAAIDLPNDEHTTRIHLWGGSESKRVETCQVLICWNV